MISSRILLFYFAFLSIAASFAGQTDSLVFRIDSINEPIVLDKCWKFHSGDDTLYASPEYNDSHWDTISTQLNLLNIEEGVFEGSAWFRIHLQIDSSLRNRTYALLIDQQGASEIYLNGLLIHKAGLYSQSEEDEETYNPKYIPGLLEFDSSLNYTMAVRYSNLHAQRNMKIYQEANAGFTVEINDHRNTMENMMFQLKASYLVFFLLMVFLVLSLVHLLLFLFYRKQKSNLYYSIFMFLFSALIFVVFLSNSIIEKPSLLNKAGFYLSLAFPLFFVPLTGFIYSLFWKKIPRIFWFTLSAAVVMSLLYYFDVLNISVLYIIFVLLLWIEVTRVIIWAMIKKFDGAWIIGIGVLFFILFFTLVMIYIIRNGDLALSGQSTFTIIFTFSLLAAILSIPFSMSVYLARDFARTNVNLTNQLEQVKILSAKTLDQEREKKRILEGQKEKLEVLVKERTKELAAEKEKSEELLLNTLPIKVVNELKQNGKAEPESFEDVTVYFSDIVGFTSISSQLEPKLLISELNEIFTGFDDIMEKYNCERIKTIGDAYLAVSGMPEKNENHASDMLHAASEIKHFLAQRNKSSEIEWKVRIGIHTGRVVGGIVGVKKYIYDVFGDTINTTSRMESNSEPMRINISETTYQLVKDKFSFINREPMEIKGKGLMKMYFLD